MKIINEEKVIVISGGKICNSINFMLFPIGGLIGFPLISKLISFFSCCCNRNNSRVYARNAELDRTRNIRLRIYRDHIEQIFQVENVEQLSDDILNQYIKRVKNHYLNENALDTLSCLENAYYRGAINELLELSDTTTAEIRQFFIKSRNKLESRTYLFKIYNILTLKQRINGIEWRNLLNELEEHEENTRENIDRMLNFFYNIQSLEENDLFARIEDLNFVRIKNIYLREIYNRVNNTAEGGFDIVERMEVVSRCDRYTGFLVGIGGVMGLVSGFIFCLSDNNGSKKVGSYSEFNRVLR